MSVSIFSFGKKRRSRRSRKSRKSMKRNGKKPSAKVMRMCRKCKVKTTKKVGKRRVYRPESLLVKLCKKKMRKMKKRTMKKRKSRFGSSCSPMKQVPAFGKRRRSRKVRKSRKVKKSVSRSAAMKAFKKFYSLHCRPSLRRSRFGRSDRMGGGMGGYNLRGATAGMMMFGNPSGGVQIPYGAKEPFSMIPKLPGMKMGKNRFGAGNPHTSMMMGYEFCPNGGGVLDTPGLFGAPCKPAAPPPQPAAAATAGATAGNAFGKKKRKGSKKASKVPKPKGVKKASKADVVTPAVMEKLKTEFGLYKRRSKMSKKRGVVRRVRRVRRVPKVRKVRKSRKM